jgi:hypothetical protein
MHIIFGHLIPQLPDSYTLLELDTFVDKKGHRSTAWCVVEYVPLTEFVTLDTYRDLHHNLMTQYRQGNWDYCRGAIESLAGRWNGEVDSFYEILLQRINQQSTESNQNSQWDGLVSVPDLETCMLATVQA